MAQEATTVAVSEPAVSFQYDSSQSLYEQLTKAQQANSSSFSAQQQSYSQSQSTSPVMRAMDSMPPPNMMHHPMPQSMPQSIPQSMPPQMPPSMTSSMPQSMPPLAEGMDAMAPYGTMTMAPAMSHHVAQVKREPDFTRVHYNQNGVPVTQSHQRHASMPAFGLEYSPAPSFVSSHYEDYSNRGISFEPVTPPQQALGMSAEPAYIANEETGLYSAVPDHMSSMNGMNGMGHMTHHVAMNGSHQPRSYGANNVYSVIEGSPTYKQRRRRSSISQSMSGISATTAAPTTGSMRPSDLRRSVSASVGTVAEGDESADNSPPGLSFSASGASVNGQQFKDVDMSRHGTPLSTAEGGPALNPLKQQHEYSHGANEDVVESHQSASGPNGAVRRARSATVMELGPYPHKSHSCPIPTCGRLFKRLEHLKR